MAGPAITAEVLAVLKEGDDELRIEHSLEPGWLVAETLFALCHEEIRNSGRVSEIVVGGVASCWQASRWVMVARAS